MTRYQFTGQFSNVSDFGLMYYGSRWYDSSLGRFAQADSIVPAGVQGLDRYGYVNNNPVKYTDPSGHMAACNPMEDDCHNGSDSISENNGGGGNPHNNDSPDEDGLIYKAKSQIDWKDELSDFLYSVANTTQIIAMLIDIPFAVTEGVFIVGECIMAFPEGCATGAFMGQAEFNLTGANAAEGFLGLISLISTGVADVLDDGQLGEATSTSYATFATGGVMWDPIGDLVVDAYAVGYNAGKFNGIESLMNGDPFFIK